MVKNSAIIIALVVLFSFAGWSAAISSTPSEVLQNFLNSAKVCPPIIITARQDLYDAESGKGKGLYFITLLSKGERRHYEMERGKEVSYLIDLQGVRYGDPDMETQSVVPLTERLLFDTHGMDLMTLTGILQDNGIDCALVGFTQFQGQNLAIIGAENPGDNSPQLWLDTSNWRPVRLLLLDETGNTLDTQFSQYKETSSGFALPWLWVTTQGSVVVSRVAVSDVREVPEIPEDQFVPGEFK
jgi:outer membrane lipoprotein-sorting protein